jgi:hypothetical protein
MIVIYTDARWEDMPRAFKRQFPRRCCTFLPWSEAPALWFWMV